MAKLTNIKINVEGMEELLKTRVKKCSAIDCSNYMNKDNCKLKLIFIDENGQCWHYNKYVG